MFKYFLLFTTMPLLELALLIKLGQLTNLFTTIFIVMLTGFIGVALAKNQGFQIIRDIQWDLSQGRIPGNQVLEGLLILAGGLLLLTPGLITDTLGFMTLIPFTRVTIRELLKKKLRKWIDTGNVYIHINK